MLSSIHSRSIARTLLDGVALLSLVGGASLASAASASAAGSAFLLPPGTQLTALDRVTGALAELDPDTAARTAAGAIGGTDFADLDVDDDGRGYAITFPMSAGGPFRGSTIQAVDLVAGTTSAPVPIVHDDGSLALCSTIDFTGGTVLADCVVDRAGVPASLFGTIDPTTGTLSTVWEYSSNFTDLGGGLATDPTTGDLYLFASTSIFRVDLATQTLDEVVTGMTHEVIQGGFDRDGVYWASLDMTVGPDWGLDTSLAAVDVTTGAQEVRGSLDTDGDPTTPSAWGLAVWGSAPVVPPVVAPAAPTLPATGAGDVVGAALLGGVLLAAGGAALRRQARSR